jgi:hypothetical protein
MEISIYFEACAVIQTECCLYQISFSLGYVPYTIACIGFHVCSPYVTTYNYNIDS